MDIIDISLSEERSRRAASFIKRLSDPEDLREELDSLNDTMRNLIHKASEDNQNERDCTLCQLCHLTDISDMLVYIARNNLYKKLD